MTRKKVRNPFLLQCRNLMLDCTRGPQVVGILNVTPDSFSDGGLYMDRDTALARAGAMVREGATVIDVGGASSRPSGAVYGAGAAVVPPEEESGRIVPVIEAIVQALPSTVVSADTYHPSVARAALAAGAHMINDITGLRHYPEMAEVVAAHDAALIVMHAVGRPGELLHEHAYTDVTAEVCGALELSLYIARAAGVQDLVVDPGFGFGKTAEQNLTLVGRLGAVCALGRPVMVGLSRKSTIGKVLQKNSVPAPVDGRLFGTLGVTAVAVTQGAHLIRTHDVGPTAEMIRAMQATMSVA